MGSEMCIRDSGCCVDGMKVIDPRSDEDGILFRLVDEVDEVTTLKEVWLLVTIPPFRKVA